MHTQTQSNYAPAATGLIQARVVDAGEDICRLSGASGSFTARRAASCLLQPAAGDTVLLAEAGGSLWVLAVLVRGDSPAVLPLPADSTVKVAQGGLKLAVQEELTLAAGKQLNAVAPEVSVQAARAGFTVGVLQLAAGLVDAVADQVKTVAGMLDTAAERVRLKAGSSHRQIEDLEHLQAGQLNYAVKTVLNMRGKHAVMSAESEVRLDGERIHLG
ncbi:MAG TPA: DUF3540 domain-containing protein [Gammaproteobacteria bacterium]|nr:DUF3540 domain-containing protein [Gammaproteobacteria bacterium]